PAAAGCQAALDEPGQADRPKPDGDDVVLGDRPAAHDRCGSPVSAAHANRADVPRLHSGVGAGAGADPAAVDAAAGAAGGGDGRDGAGPAGGRGDASGTAAV